ncbi:MAG: peptidoglycan DD-metalloendopeptidase family protein [Brevundimonas sp.]|uniref:peptidoglycan DD-metalloendopeptidase family protein n=1 Tax=Brevundimonas sp. TaxID=1871086 RepID=UPI00391C6483
MTGWTILARRALIIAGAAATLAACASYPSEPRYPTRPTTGAPAQQSPWGEPVPNTPPTQLQTRPDIDPYEPTPAPYEPIEAQPLPPTGQPQPRPDYLPDQRPGEIPPAPARPGGFGPGATYVIQPGDTISGVARRFQTPVQTLITLNGLAPRADISAGRGLVLPDSAVDTGPDPYATGPSPRGVLVPETGAPPPPPPPPPSGNPAAPPPNEASTGQGMFEWPLRGDIVRNFGQVGVSERNNGIHIGATAGAPVRAAAGGRVGYVGSDQPGLGLAVIIIHRDGWRTVYAHLGSSTVSFGDDVRQGQEIGTVGLTAGDGRPSIAFEVRHMRDGQPVAVDPRTVLPR